MVDRKYTIMSTICKTFEFLSNMDDYICEARKECRRLDGTKEIQMLLDRICINMNLAKDELRELRDKLVNDESIEGGDFL